MGRLGLPTPPRVKYFVPGGLSIVAVVNLYGAISAGYVRFCGRHRTAFESCRVLSASDNPTRFQHYLYANWALLAVSVVMAYVMWRYDRRRHRN